MTNKTILEALAADLDRAATSCEIEASECAGYETRDELRALVARLMARADELRAQAAAEQPTKSDSWSQRRIDKLRVALKAIGMGSVDDHVQSYANDALDVDDGFRDADRQAAEQPEKEGGRELADGSLLIGELQAVAIDGIVRNLKSSHTQRGYSGHYRALNEDDCMDLITTWEGSRRDARHSAHHPDSGEWQPIETAPKDGEWFLAVSKWGRIRMVRWADYGGDKYPINDEEKMWDTQPTHWMSLPPAPKDQQP